MSELLEVAKRLKEKSNDRSDDMKKLYQERLSGFELDLKNSLNTSANELERYTKSRLDDMMKKQEETMNCFQRYLNERTENLNRDLNKTSYAWHRLITKSLIVGLAIFAGLFLGSFGAMKYLSWSTMELWKTRDALQAEVAQMVNKGAWGLSYRETKDGKFITIPQGYSTDWTCAGKPCVKLNK